jgi:hypothetical protein
MELSLVSTKDLIDELQNRFDSLILHGFLNSNNTKEAEVFFSTVGTVHTCIGLAEILKAQLIRDSFDIDMGNEI